MSHTCKRILLHAAPPNLGMKYACRDGEWNLRKCVSTTEWVACMVCDGNTTPSKQTLDTLVNIHYRIAGECHCSIKEVVGVSATPT